MKVQEKRGKILYLLGFLISIYFFIFAIMLMKFGFSDLSESALNLTRNNISPLNAVGFGWLLTLITQSSGASVFAIIAFNTSGIIGASLLIFLILGTRIGNTITSFFVSMCLSAKRRDFRHGFEIGLANLIYAIPISVLMFLLEYFFRLFSNLGKNFVSLGIPFKLDFIEFITIPLIEKINFFPEPVLLLFGILLLLTSINLFPKFLLLLWGEESLKYFLNKHMKNKWKSFAIGLVLTLILSSTAITFSLLIPLIVKRTINLKKSIPYLIGGHLGGVTDTILGGLVVGESSLPAIFAYISFSLIGLLWLFNTDIIFNLTKYISKKTLHISRKKALLFILIFILLALILSFI